jgi:hypothetical protein
MDSVNDERAKRLAVLSKRMRDLRPVSDPSKSQNNSSVESRVSLNQPLDVSADRQPNTRQKRSSEKAEPAIHGDDMHYRAYAKRRARLIESSSTVSENNSTKMVQELEETLERRKKFKRRRAFYEDEEVSYISEKNRSYNLKSDKHASKFQ